MFDDELSTTGFQPVWLPNWAELLFVEKQENAESIRKVGMIPAATAEEAIVIAKEKLGHENYTITVMTAVANTVPVMKVNTKRREGLIRNVSNKL